MISFPELLRWFTSLSLAPSYYLLHTPGVYEPYTGYPIRQSADHRIYAPPRGFSQLITAFIASQLHRHPPWTYISLGHTVFLSLKDRATPFSFPSLVMSNISHPQ